MVINNGFGLALRYFGFGIVHLEFVFCMVNFYDLWVNYTGLNFFPTLFSSTNNAFEFPTHFLAFDLLKWVWANLNKMEDSVYTSTAVCTPLHQYTLGLMKITPGFLFEGGDGGGDTALLPFLD